MQEHQCSIGVMGTRATRKGHKRLSFLACRPPSSCVGGGSGAAQMCLAYKTMAPQSHKMKQFADFQGRLRPEGRGQADLLEQPLVGASGINGLLACYDFFFFPSSVIYSDVDRLSCQGISKVAKLAKKHQNGQKYKIASNWLPVGIFDINGMLATISSSFHLQ